MRSTLHIGKGFSVPVEAVTQTFAILAKRGKGKTYTASVMAEEMLAAGQQLVAVDPLGVWWGLRAGAGGKTAGGLAIVILGGKHADLPLDPASGKLVAELVVERGLSCVLDLSELSKSDMRRFVVDFAEEIYRRNESPLHLFLDEADIFAPQRIPSGDERMMGAIDALVRRGRAKGIGVTMISQRPAVLHKDVLTQAEVLVCMGMTGPQDRKAVEEWVRYHGDEERKKQLLQDLAGLDVGEAYVWSPGWLDLFAKVKIRERKTFDSSATPKVGKTLHAPKELARVELEELREHLAVVVRKQKENDPRELRARVQQLERELIAAKGKATPAEASPRDVAAATKPLEAKIRELVALGQKREKLWAAWKDRVEKTFASVSKSHAELLDLAPGKLDGVNDALRETTEASTPARTRTTSTTPRPPTVPRARPATDDADGALSAPQQRMLDWLAELGMLGWEDVSRPMLAGFAGLSPDTGHFRALVGNLVSRGLLETPQVGRVRATDAGRGRARPRASPLTRDELQERLGHELSGPQRDMLRVLVGAYPDGLSRVDLAAKVDLEANTGHFRALVGKLSTLGIVLRDGPGRVRLAPWVMLEQEGR